MQTAEHFRTSDARQWSGPLLALWWVGQGNWERAHELAQEADGRDGAWVHAYLHRMEGDAANAAYWYRRAGRSVASGELDQEWAAMVEQLISTGQTGGERHP